MDLLQGVKEGADANDQQQVPDPTDPAALEKLLDFLSKSDQLSDADKEELRKGFLERAQEASEGFARNAPPLAENGGYTSTQIIIFILVVGFIASIFTFIGYKIYKPMADREKKQAQKRLLKESKKKRK